MTWNLTFACQGCCGCAKCAQVSATETVDSSALVISGNIPLQNAARGLFPMGPGAADANVCSWFGQTFAIPHFDCNGHTYEFAIWKLVAVNATLTWTMTLELEASDLTTLLVVRATLPYTSFVCGGNCTFSNTSGPDPCVTGVSGNLVVG